MALPIPPITDPDGRLDPEAVQFALDQIAKNFPLRVGTDNFVRVPQARAYNSAAIAVATATVTTLTLNSEDYDYGTTTEQHSTAANTSRLTCRVPGLYDISAHLEYAANAVGYRALGIFYNGAATIALQRGPAVADGTVTALSVSTSYRLVVGDYIEMVTLQNSGGNLNAQASANYSPYLAWHWVSP